MPELKDTKSSPGRLRITLLAGAMALAFAGGAVVSGVVGTLPGAALAQTEEAASVPAEMAPATTAAPFDFADLAAQVRGSVVSVQVEGGRPDVAMRDPGTPRGSATGWWRSAIRSASAAR
jgi:hypothetical protein